MDKAELQARVAAAKAQTREALQAVYDALNQGQRKKLVKKPEVAALLERYGVEVEVDA